MTEADFRQHAENNEPVRLKDRSTCLYVNEWYLPVVEDGRLRIDTHTGEVHDVDAGMLEALRGRGPGTAVGDIARAIAGLDPATRIVVKLDDDTYADLAPAVTEAVIALDSEQATGDRTHDRHGPEQRAATLYAASEKAVVIEAL